MGIAIDSLLLVLLFGVLGFTADLAVRNIKYITTALKLKLFSLGILLGIVTSLPELSVGINTTAENVASLSVGNIMGGIIVIFGLILGVSLLFDNKVSTKGSLKSLVPSVLVMLSPILLGLDGKYLLWDGLVMISLYVGLLLYLYLINHSFEGLQTAFLHKKRVEKAIFLSIVGIVIVVLSSHFIVDITVDLLENTSINKLFIGVIVFSIGTNLPEIIVTFTSWRRKTSGLSLSHLVSSAFTNILVLGILAIIQPITFTLGPTFYSLAVFIVLILSIFIFSSYSGGGLSRKEGFVLLTAYVLFLAANIFLSSL